MIRRILHFYLICQFVFEHAEPLIGENVWPAANREKFNFIASLGIRYPTPSDDRGHYCGGSLITKQHVLTAAHCLDDVEINNVYVIIGEVNLTIPSPRYEVREWVTYNQWAVAQRRRIEFPTNDIAIVTLTTMVNRPDVKPIVLTPLNNERLHRTKAVIAGWGVRIDGTRSDILRGAIVKIGTPEECSNRVRLICNRCPSVGKNYLCSFAEPYALTSCGDSGGPILDQDNFLLGVIRSTCPNATHQWGNFPVEFINQYKVNVHPSVDCYRGFIEAQTGLRTRLCG